MNRKSGIPFSYTRFRFRENRSGTDVRHARRLKRARHETASAWSISKRNSPMIKLYRTFFVQFFPRNRVVLVSTALLSIGTRYGARMITTPFVIQYLSPRNCTSHNFHLKFLSSNFLLRWNDSGFGRGCSNSFLMRFENKFHFGNFD